MKLFSAKTFFEVLADIWSNLTSLWFGALLGFPAVTGVSTFSEYVGILTRNILFGILGLLITLALAEKSKSL